MEVQDMILFRHQQQHQQPPTSQHFKCVSACVCVLKSNYYLLGVSLEDSLDVDRLLFLSAIFAAVNKQQWT